METNTYYYAGIDIGSTTVKLVLLNEAGEMVWGEYRRHCAHTQETLAEMMREARKKLGACRVKVRMTGSGAISLAEAVYSSTSTMRKSRPITCLSPVRWLCTRPRWR